MQGYFYSALCGGGIPQFLVGARIFLSEYAYSHIRAKIEMRINLRNGYAVNSKTRYFQAKIGKQFFYIRALFGSHFFVNPSIGIFPADKLALCQNNAVDFHIGGFLQCLD